MPMIAIASTNHDVYKRQVCGRSQRTPNHQLRQVAERAHCRERQGVDALRRRICEQFCAYCEYVHIG